MGSFVKICFDGILKFKKKDKVSPLPSCQVGEEVYCEGEVIEEKICNEEVSKNVNNCFYIRHALIHIDSKVLPLRYFWTWVKGCDGGAVGCEGWKCENGEIVRDPPPCQLGEKMFCHEDIIDEKICNEEVGLSCPKMSTY